MTLLFCFGGRFSVLVQKISPNWTSRYPNIRWHSSHLLVWATYVQLRFGLIPPDVGEPIAKRLATSKGKSSIRSNSVRFAWWTAIAKDLWRGREGTCVELRKPHHPWWLPNLRNGFHYPNNLIACLALPLQPFRKPEISKTRAAYDWVDFELISCMDIKAMVFIFKFFV